MTFSTREGFYLVLLYIFHSQLSSIFANISDGKHIQIYHRLAFEANNFFSTCGNVITLIVKRLEDKTLNIS